MPQASHSGIGAEEAALGAAGPMRGLSDRQVLSLPALSLSVFSLLSLFSLSLCARARVCRCVCACVCACVFFLDLSLSDCACAAWCSGMIARQASTGRKEVKLIAPVLEKVPLSPSWTPSDSL